jgi:hypothetical protein
LIFLNARFGHPSGKTEAAPRNGTPLVGWGTQGQVSR